jgi:nitrogen regulatory protein P-II 1
MPQVSGRPGAFFIFAERRRHEAARTTGMIKVEAVVIRERVETVIDAVEAETRHVGVTVVEAIGHGRQRGITHEYRGRTFESRFLPKAVLTFVVRDDVADDVVAAIVDAARSGNESGDGIVWTSPVGNVTHNRTRRSLEQMEVR